MLCRPNIPSIFSELKPETHIYIFRPYFVPDYRNVMSALPIHESLRTVKHLNSVLNYFVEHTIIVTCRIVLHSGIEQMKAN